MRSGSFLRAKQCIAGFKPDGALDQSGQAIPPSSVRSIRDALIEKGISFRYYGGGFNFAVSGDVLSVLYCPICNPFQFLSSIMTNPSSRAEHLKDIQDLIADIGFAQPQPYRLCCRCRYENASFGPFPRSHFATRRIGFKYGLVEHADTGRNWIAVHIDLKQPPL